MRNVLEMMLLAELMMAADEETKNTTSKADEIYTNPFGLTGEEIEKIAAKSDEVRKFLTKYGLKSEPKTLDAESVVLSLDELLQLKKNVDERLKKARKAIAKRGEFLIKIKDSLDNINHEYDELWEYIRKE